MRVKNLVSWAGHHFSYVPGEEIDLPDDVASARIVAGLAEAIDPPAEALADDKPARKSKRS